ncbi:hypothetical protein [Streptomyces tailanensis]|uniref:hypothetical protein n=1 Tax=Streptomyces tailanensis TaxID=2569858 RepID=UPI001FE8D634|nr:hypothetical protein [Streptomyces tailanensis]
MPFTEKLLTVPPPIEVAGRRIKRYHVTADPAGIAPEVEKAAYALLPELLPEHDGTPPATFVVLHRGGDDGAYLNVYSWVWDNVLHFAGAAAGQPVLGCPDRDPTLPQFSTSLEPGAPPPSPPTGRGSAASGNCRRSSTNGTPGYGICSRPKSPTSTPT